MKPATRLRVILSQKSRIADLKIARLRRRNRRKKPTIGFESRFRADFHSSQTGSLDDKVLRTAITRHIGAVLKGDEDEYAAITGILRRNYPRFQGLAGIEDDTRARGPRRLVWALKRHSSSATPDTRRQASALQTGKDRGEIIKRDAVR